MVFSGLCDIVGTYGSCVHFRRQNSTHGNVEGQDFVVGSHAEKITLATDNMVI